MSVIEFLRPAITPEEAESKWQPLMEGNVPFTNAQLFYLFYDLHEAYRAQFIPMFAPEADAYWDTELGSYLISGPQRYSKGNHEGELKSIIYYAQSSAGVEIASLQASHYFTRKGNERYKLTNPMTDKSIELTEAQRVYIPRNLWRGYNSVSLTRINPELG